MNNHGIGDITDVKPLQVKSVSGDALRLFQMGNTVTASNNVCDFRTDAGQAAPDIRL